MQSLIAFPRVNPEGDSGAGQIGEVRVAEYLEKLLLRYGAQIQMWEARPDQPNYRRSMQNGFFWGWPEKRVVTSAHKLYANQDFRPISWYTWADG